MAKFNYYLSKKPHGGFKVGEKVATYIAVNNEFLTGILRYFEVFSDGVYAVFGEYRAKLEWLQAYRPYMDGGSVSNSVQLSINF